MNRDYMTKEFSVNVSSHTLNLTFAPLSEKENAFAFVSGVEIVSTPQIFGLSNNVFDQTLIVGLLSTMTVNQYTALETVVRLNVGGDNISPGDDSGLYRAWTDDEMYIYGDAVGVAYPKDPNVTINYSDTVPEYIAPQAVYGTARSMSSNASVNLNYNLTWIVTVDPEFYYLVRLHFCEITYPITEINMRVFDIFINNQTATQNFDVIARSNGGGIGVPVYLDFIVFFPNTSASSQQDIWVSLHPDIANKPVGYDAELNGLEIFKLNDSTGNLAGPNPPMTVNLAKQKKHNRHFPVIEIGVPVTVLFILLLAFMALRCLRQEKVMMQSCVSSPSNQSRLFSVSEIKTATKDFSESLLIGVGGFGKVYKGEIDGGSTCVAGKRGNRLSNQGAHEYRTEIDMLSKLRHQHLVSIVGYCDENDETILVYDYMANGTLRDDVGQIMPSNQWSRS